MTLLSIVDYFKEIPFCNVSIDKPKIKRLKNVDLLAELSFYHQLNIIKTDHAFSGYAMSYKVEIVDKNDVISQLEASKSSIKDLFNDLLNETKGFKYQITEKVLLKKYKRNEEIEFTPVYFNSSTKTIISNRFKLEHAFQEILYRIDAWINKGSGWIIELIESQYINISTYRPLVGSSYIDLPIALKQPKKGLTKIKNNDQKCFLWCHVRHINHLNEYPERITRINKEIACNLNYDEIKFPVEEKDFEKIEVQNNICINVFGYENDLVFPVYISDQTFKSSIDLLLLINDDQSHYVYIKDFNTFMFHKTKNKNIKWFCKSCLQCFSSENVLIKHKEDCLTINGQQPINLEKVTIEFKNYFKQLPVLFKIYAGFECNLKNVDCYEGSYRSM